MSFLDESSVEFSTILVIKEDISFEIISHPIRIDCCYCKRVKESHSEDEM